MRNSTLRNHIEPGTVIKVFGRMGVVYSDEPGGMVRLNCLDHETFAFNPELMKSEISYEILDDHPEIALHDSKWDFVENINS